MTRNRNIPCKADSRAHRRPGVALVTVLLLLTLLITVVAEIVSLSGTEELLATRQVNDLRHQLGLQNTIDLVARLLQTDPNLRNLTDRGQSAALSLALPSSSVTVQVRNDGGKFDVAAFAGPKQATLLADKLRSVGRRKGLPTATVLPQPILEPLPGSRPYLWFDQLFQAADPLAVFAWPGDPRLGDRWSDWVTVFGGGRVDLEVADEPILTAMLDDLQDGLGRFVLGNRPTASANPQDAIETSLQGIEQQAVRDAARSRLAWGLDRYSLLVASTIGTDSRIYYVILTAPRTIVYDGPAEPTVLLRRQIRW